MKADAYGVGASIAAPALAKAGARTFFTATLGEALAVRKALGPGPVIYVLNGPSRGEPALFTAAQLTPVLNSLDQIALWNGSAALHVDTGMNRLGLAPSEASAAAAQLKDVPLVMSHLACASLPGHALNSRQRARFLAAAAFFPNARKSLAATAGAQLGADYHFDLLRIGMGLYGAADRDEGIALHQIATITAPLLQVRDVAAGESIGYGGATVAQRPIKAATAAFGYADGFLRSLAGRGYGVLGGGKRPILGRVSMDLVILDVTGCPEAEPGAQVEFLGADAPLDDVAACAGTNSYEILTTMYGTVRRTGSMS